MVPDTALFNTQHYKVRIKGKVEQSREWSSALPYTSAVATEKGAFGSPSTKVANFLYIIYICITILLYICIASSESDVNIRIRKA